MDLPSAEGHTGGTTAGQVIAQPKVTPPPRGHKSRPTHTSRTILHIFFWFLACAVCHFDYRIATPGAAVRNTKERQKHCGTNFEYAFANESKEILKSNKTDAQKKTLYNLCMYTQLTTTYCSKSPQDLAPQQPMPQGFEQTSQVHLQAYRTKKLKSDEPVASKKILYDLSMITNLTTISCSQSLQELAKPQLVPHEMRDLMLATRYVVSIQHELIATLYDNAAHALCDRLATREISTRTKIGEVLPNFSRHSPPRQPHRKATPYTDQEHAQDSRNTTERAREIANEQKGIIKCLDKTLCMITNHSAYKGLRFIASQNPLTTNNDELHLYDK